MLKLKIFFILCIFHLITMPTHSQTTPTFTLTIQNIKSTKGIIRVAFYDKSGEFPSEKTMKFGMELKPEKTGEITVAWKDIPVGEYAIAVFQDLNNNKKLDKNLFGYPKEPFGFSKNFKPKLSAPTFNDCKINFNNNLNNFSIKLID